MHGYKSTKRPQRGVSRSGRNEREEFTQRSQHKEFAALSAFSFRRIRREQSLHVLREKRFSPKISKSIVKNDYFCYYRND